MLLAESNSAWCVPLVITVQKLARYARSQSHTGTSFVKFYIEMEYAGHEQIQRMLLQAFDLRVLTLLIDGMDEAAALRRPLERFILGELVSWAGRMVVTCTFCRPNRARPHDEPVPHLEPFRLRGALAFMSSEHRRPGSRFYAHQGA